MGYVWNPLSGYIVGIHEWFNFHTPNNGPIIILGPSCPSFYRWLLHYFHGLLSHKIRFRYVWFTPGRCRDPRTTGRNGQVARQRRYGPNPSLANPWVELKMSNPNQTSKQSGSKKPLNYQVWFLGWHAMSFFFKNNIGLRQVGRMNLIPTHSLISFKFLNPKRT